MDDFARSSPADRNQLFAVVAENRGLSSHINEKDFWVCWTLKRLFALPDLPAELLFKGGTSLSKVFGVIERFSEDVDLSFDRTGLGFEGENDPFHARSGKQRQRGLEALAEKCREVVRDRMLPQLAEGFRRTLGEPSAATWEVESDSNDPGGQTLLFRFPTSVETSNYVRSVVRLEFGARSDPWPTVDGTVTPYAAEDLPDAFGEPACVVRTLAAERTFWEKATILHMWYHAPAKKPYSERQSRHYYDLVRLYGHDVGKAAIRDVALLRKVAEHKEKFFPAAWARYAEAQPGTLRLVPPDERLPELKDDYRRMREMFFREPPEFEQLLETLRRIEAEINVKAPAGRRGESE